MDRCSGTSLAETWHRFVLWRKSTLSPTTYRTVICDMAQRKNDGTYVYETVDYMRKAIDDARKGRSTTPPAGATAAQQAAYTEAVTWGNWFKIMLDRNAV